MTVDIEWFGMAEAAVEDGRGVPALIGLDQNVVVAEKLPVTTKRVFVLLLKDNEQPTPLLPGSKMPITISVESPSGATLVATTQLSNVGEKRFPDVPLGFRMFAELGLNLEDYGRYVAKCKVELPDGSSIEAETKLYVISKND